MSLYSAVINNLQNLPEDQLHVVNQFLIRLRKTDFSKGKVKAILSHAGDWSDFTEEEFKDILAVAKRSWDIKGGDKYE